jgi:hypothetical protein
MILIDAGAGAAALWGAFDLLIFSALSEVGPLSLPFAACAAMTMGGLLLLAAAIFVLLKLNKTWRRLAVTGGMLSTVAWIYTAVLFQNEFIAIASVAGTLSVVATVSAVGPRQLQRETGKRHADLQN